MVLIVSELPEKENQEWAARIAGPVCDYLRRLEKSSLEKSSAARRVHQLSLPELAMELKLAPRKGVNSDDDQCHDPDQPLQPEE